MHCVMSNMSMLTKLVLIWTMNGGERVPTSATLIHYCYHQIVQRLRYSLELKP